MALAPWVLLPVVHIASTHAQDPTGHSTTETAHQHHRDMRWWALSSAIAVLALGAVNAVATLIAILPAAIWWISTLIHRPTRTRALRFGLWWIPAGVLACLWWIGPLLVLGRYSPPFTDYIESSRITTRWLNPMEVLRGTTSWTPFLSAERQGGFALVTEPVLIVSTLLVALLGLWGLRHPAMPHKWRWIAIFLLGFGAMVLAVEPFSPLGGWMRTILDGAGAPLRNLHKFDPLVRIALVAGVAHSLRTVRWPGWGTSTHSRKQWALWAHPEKNLSVVQCIATALLIATVTSTGWSGRIPAVDAYREIPDYWKQAAAWLNEHAEGIEDSEEIQGAEGSQSAESAQGTQGTQGVEENQGNTGSANNPSTTPPQNPSAQNHHIARTLILPKASFARQTWGNTRDEPAQPLLNIPWVVRDSIPLVQPEAIRALDSLQRELESGSVIPTLAATLRNQGIGQVLVRTDLVESATTPGAKMILKTLSNSGGFQEVATFGQGEGGSGNQPAIHIFRIIPSPGSTGTAGDLRIIDRDQVETVAAGPEALPRLAAADRALGRTADPRTRILASSDIPGSTPHAIQTITDTPALRDHNYGSVVRADSDILAPTDPAYGLNPVRDYPVRGMQKEDYTQVTQVGDVSASSSAADPTSFTGADTTSGITAAVDGQTSTAWRPASGSISGQWIELRTQQAHRRLHLSITIQGGPVRMQVTSLLRGEGSDPHSPTDTQAAIRNSTTVSATSRTPARVTLPVGDANAVRITLLSSFGDVGISELSLVDGRTGEDYTPRRIVTVPEIPQHSDGAGTESPAMGAENSGNAAAQQGGGNGASNGAVGNASSINRWVFGQEIPEGTLIRQFTMPSRPGGMATDKDGNTAVLISTSECEAHPGITGNNSKEPTRDAGDAPPSAASAATTGRTVTIDGQEYSCGDVIRVSPGQHTLATQARWVALSAAEPLYAAAVRDTPAATAVPIADGSGGDANTLGDNYRIDASSKERILYIPSDSNPGRLGLLHTSTGVETLQPITVNGWQQGWIIPAGASGTFTMSFAATGFYHWWLIAGLLAALVLLAAWATTTWRIRLWRTSPRGAGDALGSRAEPDTTSGEGATDEDTANAMGGADGTDSSSEAGSGKAKGSGAAAEDAEAVSRGASLTSHGEPVILTGLRRVAQGGLFSSFAMGTILAARNPWGSASYAGDSWVTAACFTLAVALTLVCAALPPRR